jgi:YhcH/YjgK/YiaL family protein
MVIDNLQNASLYFGLRKNFQLAFEYLQQTDFSQAANGKYELYDENVFAIVNRYETHSAEELKWEAHRKYIDVQFVASGFEQIGIVDIGEVSPVTEYDEKNDVQFFTGEGKQFPLNEKTFAIIFPHEVHKPGIADKVNSSILKVVVKVKV